MAPPSYENRFQIKDVGQFRHVKSANELGFGGQLAWQKRRLPSDQQLHSGLMNNPTGVAVFGSQDSSRVTVERFS